MDVYVETERLVLRQFTEYDVDVLVELDSDPEVMHFITGGRPTPREEIEREILPRWLRYYAETPGIGFWAAEERTTGEFVGWFHLRPGDGHPLDEPELGYRLRRSAWGKGYATEGCRALIDKAFAEHGVRRVLAETMVVHTASRRVMEKSGLHLVRVFQPIGPTRSPVTSRVTSSTRLTARTWSGRSIRRSTDIFRDRVGTHDEFSLGCHPCDGSDPVLAMSIRSVCARRQRGMTPARHSPSTTPACFRFGPFVLVRLATLLRCDHPTAQGPDPDTSDGNRPDVAGARQMADSMGYRFRFPGVHALDR